MKRRLLWISFLLFAASLVIIVSAYPGEQIDLTIPDQAVVGTSQYFVGAISMDREAAYVIIRLGSNNGIRRVFEFKGVDATNYIKALNKRDASVTSNEKWTLQQLITKGYLTGTISGLPD